METLICPKCHGPMRSYERSGVMVDQCTECRGIFLDRGELERLVDAEQAYHATPPREQSARPENRDYDDRRYDEQRRYDDRYRQPYPHRKKKSFLEELFD